LQVFNADTGALIARKDAYIPLNMRQDWNAARAEIAHWRMLAEDRRNRDRRYADEIAHTS
jgi:uncharacterized ferritin-like protein (DUF455 family)